MLQETGVVVEVVSDGLWVETYKKSSCSGCSAQKGCGQKLFIESATKPSRLKGTYIKAVFSESAQKHSWVAGDRAILGIEEGALVKSALVVYLIPLVSMVLFALVGAEIPFGETIESQSFTKTNDLGAILGALGGLISGGGVVRCHALFSKQKSCYQPVVLSKLLG